MAICGFLKQVDCVAIKKMNQFDHKYRVVVWK